MRTIRFGFALLVTAVLSAPCERARDIYFERNVGQADARIHFIGRGSNYVLLLTRDSAIFSSPRHRSAIELKLLRAEPAQAPVATTELAGKVNYLIGQDASKWHVAVATYGKIIYAGVYPGIDLIFHGSQQRLEYDFALAPGADPKRILLSLTENGAPSHPAIDSNGDLLLNRGGREIRFHKPVAWQDGEHIDVQYELMAGNSVGFKLAPYDHSKPLVIDPVVSYSTYLGGSDDEGIFGVKYDAMGNLFIAGETSSVNFPIMNPVQSKVGGDYDGFVAKFDHTGSTLLYATYLGGSLYDHCIGIQVDAHGSAYVAGVSYSSDFPVKNAIQPQLKGKSNAFVARLDPSGSHLVFSTYLGGSSYDQATDIGIDAAGNVYISGSTNSPNFLVTPNAFQSRCDGGKTHGSCIGDAFAAKFSPTGTSLLYSTYLGGSGYDLALAIAVDRDGAAYLTGQTGSADFPVKQPFQAALAGPFNAFVTKLAPDGSTLSYSTYLGGNEYDAGTAITVDDRAHVYVAGTTNSSNFPTVSPYQATNNGNGDGFISKFAADGQSLIYSTYLGGTGWDYPFRIALDPRGALAIVGFTGSSDFPVSNAPQSKYAGGYTDAFVTLLNPAGSALISSTFLGGTGEDFGYAVYADWAGNIWAGGSTGSQDFPVVNAYQPVYAGGPFDAFLTKLSTDPAESIQVLESAVNNLVFEGVLTAQDGASLSAVLRAARQAALAGNNSQAAGGLRVFVAAVHNLGNTAAAGLSTAALDIIDRF